MKRLFVFLLVASLLYSCGKKSSPDPLTIMDKVEKAYAPVQSIRMSWDYKIKGLLRKDTFKTSLDAWIYKDATDTVLGAKVMIFYHADSSWGFYLNNQGYVYSPKDSTLLHYPQKYAKYAVFGYGSRLFTYALAPEQLMKMIRDTLNQVSVSDTQINGYNLWSIKIKLPDQDDYTHRKQVYYIDKNNYFLRGYYREVYIISDWQRQFAFANDITINSVKQDYIDTTFAKIKAKAKLKELNIGDDNEQFTLLPIGKQAPDFSGTYYGTDSTFELTKQKAKVYVLDFWYQSCRPCMEAIPYLVDLYNNYKDKGVLVIGVNSIDNTDRRRPYLKKFIEYKKINYPIVLVNRAVDQMYKIPGYPTMYVLDSHFRVVGYEVGFDPSVKLSRIDSLVQSTLNR